jgi:protein SCO1/2
LGQHAEDVQVLFVSVDPERDTVAQLASYLPHFDPSFLGMTGDPDMILRAATQFGIFYESRQEAAAAYYTVDHTSTVVVIDPEGYARLVFPYGISGIEMAEDLRHLMHVW